MDQKHPKIESGDVDVAPSDLFKQKILNPLRQLLNEAPHLHIVIVPNPRDLIYDHAVFPQRSFGSFGLEVCPPTNYAVLKLMLQPLANDYRSKSLHIYP